MGTLNSMGLPNEGYKFYIDKIGKFNISYMISVAGNYLLNDFLILKELNDKIELYRINKGYEDRQDAIREILEKRLENNFWNRLKYIFNFK